MGCYDTVMAPCPQCGTKAEFQSKAGACELDTFEMNDAPPKILLDIEGDRATCEKCGIVFGLIVSVAVLATTARVHPTNAAMRACKWGRCNGEVPMSGGTCPRCRMDTP